MSRLIICYKRYTSIYENDINEWTYYFGTFAQFEAENPNVRIMFCFTDEDNLLR